MYYSNPSSFLVSIAAGLSFLLAGSFTAYAQSRSVEFETSDGVTIKGKWYGAGSDRPPCVLLLHTLGEDSRKKEWRDLAEKLQKAGFAVLSFDFRGHGESKTVDPKLFWNNPTNTAQIRRDPKNLETIDYKNFSKSYYTVLANDIAAAKSYLDKENDRGSCNSSALILIGAETGASLGALWLHSEWLRYRMVPPQFGVAAGPDMTHAYGKDTAAAVWLSISPTLGQTRVSLTSLLTPAALTNATPMVFVYNEEDKTDKLIATACEQKLKVKGSEKYEFTGSYGVKSAEKLKGRELLQESLPTSQLIVDYLKNVSERLKKERKNEWKEHDFRSAQYVWVFGPSPAQWVIAKPQSEQRFVFDTFRRFLR